MNLIFYRIDSWTHKKKYFRLLIFCRALFSPTSPLCGLKDGLLIDFFSIVRCHLGSISPNFFSKQKVAGAQHLAKNLQFNFTNKTVRLKLGQNLPKYVCHLPNAVCQKSHRILCVKNLCTNVDEIDQGPGWIFTKLFTQIRKNFCKFRP